MRVSFERPSALSSTRTLTLVPPPGGGVSETTAPVEHDNFLRAIVNATPMGVMKPGSDWMTDSTLSLDSIYSSTNNGAGVGGLGSSSSSSHLETHATPDTGRKGNPFMKAMNTLRYAAG